jgi:hypothetical protein
VREAKPSPKAGRVDGTAYAIRALRKGSIKARPGACLVKLADVAGAQNVASKEIPGIPFFY